MITSQELKALLPSSLSSRVEALFKDFQQERHSQDIDIFLGYLLDKKFINEPLFQEIHASCQIELTSVGEVIQHLSNHTQ